MAGTTTLYYSQDDATTGYYSYLNSNVPSGAWNSIKDIEYCMLGNGTQLMRPAQVAELSGGIVLCDGFDCEVYHVTLNGTPQVYTGAEYENPPAGIHIYENGGTTPVQTLSGTATSTSLDIADANATFTVTSYNSSGDSYGAPSIYLSADGGDKIADGSNIQPVINSLDVTVHPNPATSSAQICVADLPGGVPAVVEVVDQIGQIVSTLYNATPDAELGLCLSLDCSKLPSGIYYVHVSNAIMGSSVKLSVSH